MTDQPYIAVLWYETVGGPQTRRHEDVLLVRAADPQAARERAELRGHNQSYRYVGAEGDKLEQRFLGVTSLTALSEDDLTSDTELLTRAIPLEADAT